MLAVKCTRISLKKQSIFTHLPTTRCTSLKRKRCRHTLRPFTASRYPTKSILSKNLVPTIVKVSPRTLPSPTKYQPHTRMTGLPTLFRPRSAEHHYSLLLAPTRNLARAASRAQQCEGRRRAVLLLRGFVHEFAPRKRPSWNVRSGLRGPPLDPLRAPPARQGAAGELLLCSACELQSSHAARVWGVGGPRKTHAHPSTHM